MNAHEYKEWMTGIFDRSAEIYGKKHAHFFDYFAKKLVDLADLTPATYILDVATGRGAILKQVVQIVGPLGKIIGVDISPQMIKQTAQELKHYTNIQVMCADAENLEFADNSFDAVFCGFGVFFFPNISRALKQFFRVLKPGGKLLISTWGEDDNCDIIFHEVYSQFGLQTKTLLHHFDNPQFINEILSKAGFSKVTIIADELDYVYPSFEDWFSSLWTHAARAKLEQLTPLQITHLKESLRSNLLPHLKQTGLHELLRAYYTIAIKPY